MASRETTPSMMEAQRMYDDEIPFGVRALESGAEVAGIWISRGNTPVPSAHGSPANSIAISTSSSLDHEIIPQLSLALHNLSFHGDEPQPVRSSARWTRSSPKQSRLKDRSSMSAASYTQSTQSHPPKRLRPTSLPTPSNLRHSQTMESLEAIVLKNHGTRRGRQLNATIYESY
jgi:hypothetical protein